MDTNPRNDTALRELVELEEYLAGPDRFVCEKYNCNMLKSACVTRQKNAERNDRVSSPRYHRPGTGDVNCIDCVQGKLIAEGKNPVPEQEEKNMTEEQAEYTVTMKICSRADCSHGGAPQQLDDFDTCKKSPDGKKANCKDCRRDMQTRHRLRQRALRDSKKSAPHKPEPMPDDMPVGPGGQAPEVGKTDTKPSGTGFPACQSVRQAGKPAPHPNQLIIDFSRHQEVLESISEIAAAEIRTPENQVLYWLVNYSSLVKKERCDG
jgi:hypothetical protein